MRPIINYKKIFLLLFLILFIMKSSFSQDRRYYYQYEPIPFNVDTKNKKGYDKFGRKHGEWNEICGFSCPLFYKDSSTILESSFGVGYYVDGKKQGMWDVYDQEEYDKRKLIAQIFFDKGMIVFQFTYIDNVMDCFTRIGDAEIPTNKDKTGVVLSLDKIYFDENKNVYRESYSPNGVLLKYPHPYKP